MVGVTYKNPSCRPANSKLPSNSKLPLPNPEPEQRNAEIERLPPPTFKDKNSYQELFKPLPKPEPLPELKPFKVESKSWRQLQEERESLLQAEIERTRVEAMSLWDRAREDDTKRLQGIITEKERILNEQRMREEIMRRGNEERLAMDKARREEIRRQEELLSGRKIRAKTADSKVEPGYVGGGIQVFHYKDPVVKEIVAHTQKEELRRRMSHGEILRGMQDTLTHNNGESQPSQNNGATQPSQDNGGAQFSQSNGSDGASNGPHFNGGLRGKSVGAPGPFFLNNHTRQEEMKGPMDSREQFKVNMMLRSGSSSSSSTTSR